MTIDELKGLESKHGSGWRFQDSTEDKSVSGEVQFLNAFLGLRKELLALWDAANHVSHDHSEQSPEYYSYTKAFNSALDALNAKATSIGA